MADWLSHLSKEQFLIFTGVVSFAGGILSSLVISRLTHEHATKFTRLHEQRAAKVKDLYVLVTDLEHELDILRKRASVTTPLEHKLSQFVVVEQLMDRLNKACRYDSIYFSARLCTLLDEVLVYASGLADSFSAYIKQDLAKSEFKQDWNYDTDKLRKVQRLLEREFRRLMGVRTRNF
jgi:hypothetical protein